MHAHATEAEISAAATQLQRLRETLGRVLFGQEVLIENVLIGDVWICSGARGSFARIRRAIQLSRDRRIWFVRVDLSLDF